MKLRIKPIGYNNSPPPSLTRDMITYLYHSMYHVIMNIRRDNSIHNLHINDIYVEVSTLYEGCKRIHFNGKINNNDDYIFSIVYKKDYPQTLEKSKGYYRYTWLVNLHKFHNCHFGKLSSRLEKYVRRKYLASQHLVYINEAIENKSFLEESIKNTIEKINTFLEIHKHKYKTIKHIRSELVDHINDLSKNMSKTDLIKLFLFLKKVYPK